MDQYYRHFRNKKIYRFVTFATLEATGEEAVVYQAMYADRQTWIRTKTNFFEKVLFDGQMVPRFQPVSKEEALKEIDIQHINKMREVTKLSDTLNDGIRCTSFATCGVTCSTQINLQTEGDTIRRVEIVKGCDGNTKGLAALVKDMKAEEVIARLENIRCGFKSTSCPDQLAKALKEITAKG